MKKTELLIKALLLITAIAPIAAAQSSQTDAVAESHIRANVPDDKDFDRLLKRDLAAFFKSSSERVITIEYELLRQGPTQSGVAYPKFYAWVKVYDKGALLEEGAVRIAAVEKRQFDVTNYLTRADIQRDPDSVYQIFPTAVGDKIKEKLTR